MYRLATSNMLWDQYMSTSAPINSTTKNPSWEKLAGGKVIMLLPYTTVGEKSADEGTETQTPFYHPTKASLQRFIDEDHPLLSILPANIDYLYNRTSHFASSSDIQMIFKSIPSTFGYEEYVNQIQESCDGKQSGSFDVVWLDANAAGKLGHCMVNLWNWNADIVQNQDPHILANNIHNKRLVGLPLGNTQKYITYSSDRCITCSLD